LIKNKKANCRLAVKADRRRGLPPKVTRKLCYRKDDRAMRAI